MQMVDDYNLAFNGKCINKRNEKDIWVKWDKPTDGQVKLNTNGSSLRNPGPVGTCGLLQDALGNWCVGFYCHVGVATSMQAELCVIRQGLLLTWEKGSAKLWLNLTQRKHYI